jgi:hypothetical protein
MTESATYFDFELQKVFNNSPRDSLFGECEGMDFNENNIFSRLEWKLPSWYTTQKILKVRMGTLFSNLLRREFSYKDLTVFVWSKNIFLFNLSQIIWLISFFILKNKSWRISKKTSNISWNLRKILWKKFQNKKQTSDHKIKFKIINLIIIFEIFSVCQFFILRIFQIKIP